MYLHFNLDPSVYKKLLWVCHTYYTYFGYKALHLITKVKLWKAFYSDMYN